MISNKWINFIDNGFYSDLRIENFERNVHEEKYENKFNIFRGKILFPQMTLSLLYSNIFFSISYTIVISPINNNFIYKVENYSRIFY